MMIYQVSAYKTASYPKKTDVSFGAFNIVELSRQLAETRKKEKGVCLGINEVKFVATEVLGSLPNPYQSFNRVINEVSIKGFYPKERAIKGNEDIIPFTLHGDVCETSSIIKDVDLSSLPLPGSGLKIKRRGSK